MARKILALAETNEYRLTVFQEYGIYLEMLTRRTDGEFGLLFPLRNYRTLGEAMSDFDHLTKLNKLTVMNID